MTSVAGAVRTWVAGARPPRERRARLRDVLLWAVLVTPVLARAGVRAVAEVPWWPLAVGAAVLALAVRGSRASPVLALITSAALVLLDPSFVWAQPVMSYFVGRRVPGWRIPALGFTAILVVGSVSAALGVVGWVVWVVGFAFPGIMSWLLGRYRRQHVALVHAGWERAEHLEREQRIVSEQARLRERARISQDMHDSLGHELSLIALQAGGLELAGGLDDEQRAVVGELRERAGAATEQLREMIGVLREEAGTPSTEPWSQSIDELVQRCRDAGMVVALDADGVAGGTPPMVDRAVFRVVQEALTNAAKHSPGAAVTVRVRRTGAETAVSVINPLLTTVMCSWNRPDPTGNAVVRAWSGSGNGYACSAAP
ncbi:signal transduction histidine kinase [Saccharopolyspora lacisalsi]|uniref:histidine kinase n=1 Tax=Halosaccharopolyspora lacisalsi TaxID=1000566 RepID=A0A839DT33_9PSEU|nr:histidine kinase [Halosaccharopolyspora lacisalsi]MBA8823436.1 signal transduction histidine kinase [Halosaccharopolyspora lacisalsi]